MDEVPLYDINRFPKQEGLLLFGISLSRIGNAQSAEKCFEYVKQLDPKIVKPAVGLNIIYTDSLYMNSHEEARELKRKNEPLMHAHKYAFLRLLEKNISYIQPAFTFSTWAQMILEAKDFFGYYGRLKKIYKEDARFQELVRQDAKGIGENESAENFILEEILMIYLVSKGAVHLPNEFVQGKQKWTLWCYPGKPLLSEIYLFQKNFFGLKNEENAYENCFYDLEAKKLYDFRKFDLARL